MSDQPPRVSDAPETIWLNYGDINWDRQHSELCSSGDVTWCDESVFLSDVRYVRADLFDRLTAERDALRAVCAEAYQMAGALGAPVKALDNLSAAANGDPLPHDTFLPVDTPDLVAQRDELLAVAKESLRVIDAIKPVSFGDGTQVRLRAAIASATKEQA